MTEGKQIEAEVVGFSGDKLFLMPTGDIRGVMPGARVIPLTPGLPDDWFEHDGQITKRDIRAVTLAALAPRKGELLWDIGAGSGSIGMCNMTSCPARWTSSAVAWVYRR